MSTAATPTDSNMPSFRPDIEGGSDTLRDYLRDVISRYRGHLPGTLPAFHSLCFQLCERGLAEAETAGILEPERPALDPAELQRAVLQTVRYVAKDNEAVVVLSCWVMGRLPAGLERAAIMPETLRLIAAKGRETVNARAAAILKQIGIDGRSDEAIGMHYGVGRACIQGHREEFERETGIVCRANKDPKFRAACRERRLGVRKVERDDDAPANPFLSVYRRRFATLAA